MAGTRGPQGKPTELKVLEGNRGHRPLDLSLVFRPEVGLPSVPKYFTPEALKAWKRITPELLKYNLISTVDHDALAMLCRTVGRVEILEHSMFAKMKALRNDGKDVSEAFMDQTPNGMRIQSALYQVLNKEQEKLHSLLKTFGLRPDARAGVTRAIAAQLRLFEGDGDKPAAAGAPAAPAKPTGFDGFE